MEAVLFDSNAKISNVFLIYCQVDQSRNLFEYFSIFNQLCTIENLKRMNCRREHGSNFWGHTYLIRFLKSNAKIKICPNYLPPWQPPPLLIPRPQNIYYVGEFIKMRVHKQYSTTTRHSYTAHNTYNQHNNNTNTDTVSFAVQNTNDHM